ncbi:MAG: bifunctional hydroxymethylpyrimidine kinase/phosphomethylpyrimidine kinase [Candidatus Angelobacter sp.]
MRQRTSKSPPVVLSIAGYDPSSGAGITADIKTMAAHGCYGITCVTALTIQSTRGVKRVQVLGGNAISETLAELEFDFKIAAVKIGMLGSAEAARAVAAFLRRARPRHVVLDPMIQSSSGARLISREGMTVLKRELLPLATVITPNIDEAAAFSALRVSNAEQMQAAAAVLHHMGAKAVIITGGHLQPAVDLVSMEKDILWLRGKHIKTRSTHGTGCAFSTALACHLAKGRTLQSAAQAAKKFVEQSLGTAPKVGKGTGPVI